MEEALVHHVPISKDVYQPEMVTPDYGIVSQPTFSLGDQWSMPFKVY